MADGRIDCHIHYMPSALGERLQTALAGDNQLRNLIAAQPAWRDLGVHQRIMDAAGVDVAVILPYGTEMLRGLSTLGGSLNEACETFNRAMSEDLALHSGRFLAAAVVDPFGGKEAAAQLDRSLALPAIAGVGLVASYEGIALDDKVFEPIFDVARHHDAPVLVHPSSVPQSWIETLRLDNLFLSRGLGFLLDDALCILRMATNGTFDKYHDLRFMFCQLGGVAPFCCGRWAYQSSQATALHHGRGVPLPRWTSSTLSEYLSRLWLDTHTQDRHAIALVLAEAGEDSVVLGGDHPYTTPEGGVLYAMAEIETLGLSEPAQRKIERENALRLLGPRIRGFIT